MTDGLKASRRDGDKRRRHRLSRGNWRDREARSADPGWRQLAGRPSQYTFYPGSDPRTEEPPAKGARETVGPATWARARRLAGGGSAIRTLGPSREGVGLPRGRELVRESVHLGAARDRSRGVICVCAVGVAC